MSHFLLKMIPPRPMFVQDPPRPMFVQDMTDAERELMRQHVAYSQSFFDAGALLAFGPVFDPAGSFGMGVLEMASMEEAKQMADNDPTVKAGLNTYTLVPMHVAAS